MLTITRFAHGLILTVLTALFTLAITNLAFGGNLYYMAQLQPLFMAFYLLIAWLIYLRQDNLLRTNDDSKGEPALPTHSEKALTTDLPEAKISGDEVRRPKMDERGLIRRPRVADSMQDDPFVRNTMYTLVWSAVQLGMLAAILYNLFGIGSRFFM